MPAGPQPTPPAIPFAAKAGGSAPYLAPPVLSPEQLRLIVDTRARLKGIRRAVGVAKFDGFTLAFCALITLIGSISSLPGFLLGLALGGVAVIELVSARRLTRLDPTAPKILALNQLLFAAALMVYALYNLLFPAPLPKELTDSAKDLKSLGMDIDGLNNSFNQLVYFALIASAFFIQGGMALYYYSKQRVLRAVTKSTPQWVLDLVTGLGGMGS